MSVIKPLDRYVLAEWVKIFAGTALGFPLLVIIIDLTEKLDKYLSRNLSPRDAQREALVAQLGLARELARSRHPHRAQGPPHRDAHQGRGDLYFVTVLGHPSVL